MHQYMLEASLLEGSWVEKVPGFLLDTKFTISQKRALKAKVNNNLACVASRSSEVILSIQPRTSLLECLVQFWPLQYKRDMYILEQTRDREDDKHMTYERYIQSKEEKA